MNLLYLYTTRFHVFTSSPSFRLSYLLSCRFSHHHPYYPLSRPLLLCPRHHLHSPLPHPLPLPLLPVPTLPFNSVSECVISVDNLASSNQAYNDRGTDEKGENETIHRVPFWEPSTNSSTSICKVEEVESQELSDQGIFDWHEDCGPRNCRSNDSVDVSAIAVVSSISGIFETPVDGSEERNYLLCASVHTNGKTRVSGPYNCAISNLNRSNHIQKLVCRLWRE
jgi:hypothetical protein